MHMSLGGFQVIHWPKGKAAPGDFAAPASAKAALCAQPLFFHMDTCQRELWVAPAGSGLPALPPGVHVFSGTEGYRFLLRVATGLESEILGETDVFGQMKEAWKKFALTNGTNALSPWFQKLSEDTKDIRARFLQNTGGESYGSLVRKQLRGYEPTSTDPVLIVGAGAIAHAVGPWLSEQPLLLLNRTLAALPKLRDEILIRNPSARITLVDSPEAEARAWRAARFAVLCIPVGFPPGSVAALEDSKRLELWHQGTGDRARAIIHLGGHRDSAQIWAAHQTPTSHFHALDDLFALQKDKNEARFARFAEAARACDERSILRTLPGGISGSVSHGWEDLAAFQ